MCVLCACTALRPLSDQLALATPRTDVSSDEELSSPIFSSPVSQRDLHDVDISITLAATRRAQSTLRNAPQVRLLSHHSRTTASQES